MGYTSQQWCRVLEDCFSERKSADALRFQLRQAGSRQELVLFGAGNLGGLVARALKAENITVAAFADDTSTKLGTHLEGVPIVTLEEQLRERPGSIVIPTILNDALTFRALETILKNRGARHVLPFHQLLLLDLPHLGNFYHLDAGRFLKAKLGLIAELSTIFQDDTSCEHLKAYFQSRIGAEPTMANQPVTNAYFDPVLVQRLPKEGYVFVDAGAYDGATTLEAFAQRPQPNHAILLEPDPGNASQCKDHLADADILTERYYTFLNAAIGPASGTARFEAKQTMGSRLTEEGSIEVEIMSVDQLAQELHLTHQFIYLKMDVEGAELAALKGASQCLNTGKLAICVCLYHKPNDFWEILQYLLSQSQSFDFYFRLEGADTMGTVLYAIPQ